MRRLPIIIMGALALMLALPRAAFAQDDYGVPPQGAAAAPSYTQQQLDQMIAPIALYPDPLISQVLMASTYPLEVVEASRWLQAPGNAQLQGDALAQALAQQPWDPSVKSLVNVPQVLTLMNNNLQWTEQLGNAFLAQQDQVMDSVQHLRQMAQASGHLASTPEQTVAYDSGDVVIQPANPQEMYVPYYNPSVVYGNWPYPGYAPYYFQPYPGSVYATVGGIGFGFGVVLIGNYWGWNHWDWRDHRIDIDDRRFAAINRGQPPRVSGEWTHDQEHRHNVPYSPAVRAQFQGGGVTTQQRALRGFAPQAEDRGTETRGAETHWVETRAAPAAARTAPVFTREAPVAAPAPQRVGSPQARQATPQPEAPRQEYEQHAQPHAAPAFESFSRGAEVHEQSQRGAYSRATPQAAPERAAAPAFRAPAPAARSGGGGGGHINENMRNR